MTQANLIKDEVTDRSTTTYIARAICKNHKNELVMRYAGTLRGMSDNGRPAWHIFPDHFLTADDAAAVVKYPTALNCWEGDYAGGVINIIRVDVHTVTTTKWEIVEKSS